MIVLSNVLTEAGTVNAAAVPGLAVYGPRNRVTVAAGRLAPYGAAS